MEQIQICCKQHPNRPISLVYIRKDCPLSSRLACGKCVSINNQPLENYIDFIDFLEDPFSIMPVSKRVPGMFDELNNYFCRSQKDPLAVVDEYQKQINLNIEKLKQTLSNQVAQSRKFQEMIKQAKEQFVEAVRHKKIIESMKLLKDLENYHEKQEWTNFESHVQNFIKDFHDQDNQELKLSLYALQTGDKEYFPGKIFDDFSQKNQLIYKDMCQEFQKIRPSIVSTLCDDQFNMKLIKLIDKNQKIQAKLIFKGTDDGMSAQAFWSKCQNLGPTLIFCKAENGTVFGGYSPCKWTPNNIKGSIRLNKQYYHNAHRFRQVQKFDFFWFLYIPSFNYYYLITTNKYNRYAAYLISAKNFVIYHGGKHIKLLKNDIPSIIIEQNLKRGKNLSSELQGDQMLKTYLMKFQVVNIYYFLWRLSLLILILSIGEQAKQQQ